MIELVINIAVLLYLFVAFAWNLPDSCVLRRAVQCLRGPILYGGLWHGWNMFAPDPLMANRRLSARILLADGGEVLWFAKDLAAMPWWRAFLEVRDRKWQDNLMGQGMEYLRPALVEHLTTHVSRQGLRPIEAEVYVDVRLVPPPHLMDQPGEFERRTIYLWKSGTNPT